jgi:RNA polymerase sigma factor (sigma-70 family)
MGVHSHLRAPLTDAQQKLVADNHRLLHWCARKYGDRVPKDVAVDVATDAMIRAAQCYDPNRINPETGQPYAFATYACRAIGLTFYRQTAEYITKKDREGSIFTNMEMSSGVGDTIEATAIDTETPDRIVGEADQRNWERSQINGMLAHLTQREREALSLRYGLDYGGTFRTVEATANIMGITKSRALQLINRSIEKIRDITQSQSVSA